MSKTTTCERCGDSFEGVGVCEECRNEYEALATSFIPGSADHLADLTDKERELGKVVAAAHLKLCETRAYLEWPEGYTGEQIMGVVDEALEILQAAMDEAGLWGPSEYWPSGQG